MARDTLTTIQYSLERKERKLVDLTTKVWVDPLMALAQDGKGMTTISTHGRTLRAYFNALLYPGGGKGLVAESGVYPGAQAESEIQPYTDLHLYAMTISFTEHALKAMESDSSRMKVGVNDKVKNAIAGMQRWMADQFAGRGDGTIGRANGAGTGATTTIQLDAPPLCSPGDVIYSNPDRDIATAGGEASKINGARVVDVDYDAMTITIAGDTWTDGDVIHFYGATDNTAGDTSWVQGLQAAYDQGTSTNWKYDADDSATYDHCDTYLSLTRSTTSQANVREYNVNGYPTLAKVQRLISKALLRGANPRNMVSLWNPTTYEKYCESIEGYAPKTTKLVLPGNTFEVPVIAHGMTQLPVIDSHRIPPNKILVIDKSKMYRLTAPGGWNKRDGTMWKQAIKSAGAAADASRKAEYEAFFDVWYQLAVVLPGTSTVGYGVSFT